MANIGITLGTSIIDKSADEPEKLYAFIYSVDLFNEIVEMLTEATIIQAVRNQVLRFVRTTLIDAAQHSITDNQTLQQFLDAVKTDCASKLTVNNIIAKLKTLSKKNRQNIFAKTLKNWHSI